MVISIFFKSTSGSDGVMFLARSVCFLPTVVASVTELYPHSVGQLHSIESTLLNVTVVMSVFELKTQFENNKLKLKSVKFLVMYFARFSCYSFLRSE
jgi:hypothetical protein